jgi:hypothetical protein
MALMAAGLFGLAGCGGSGGSPDTGELSLKITDMPIDHAEEVVVVFSGIELKHAGGPPFSIDFCDPNDLNDRLNCKSIDLIELQNGVTDDLLTGETVDAGQYQWMRLKVIAGPDLQDASYIALDTTGEQFPLYIPSGAETGLKLVRPFTVAQGGITQLVADFDVRKSDFAPPGIVDTNYVLKPTIRLMDELETGTIEGQVDLDALAADQGVDTTTDSCEGGVYLFNGFAVTPDDMDTDGSTGDLDDPVVYNSVAVDPMVGGSLASYSLHFVEAGEYTVAFTCDFDVDASRDISEYDPNAMSGDPGFDTMAWTIGQDNSTGLEDITVVVDETVIVDFPPAP